MYWGMHAGTNGEHLHGFDEAVAGVRGRVRRAQVVQRELPLLSLHTAARHQP